MKLMRFALNSLGIVMIGTCFQPIVEEFLRPNDFLHLMLNTTLCAVGYMLVRV